MNNILYFYSMRYYLYKHTRLDKNEPFYIGIAKKSDNYISYKQEYKRAYDFSQRGVYWKNIKNITDIKVDILYECDSEFQIKEKEKEYIGFFGRKVLNEGPLINGTDGGDGRLNPSPETIINNGRNLAIYHELYKRKVYQYSLQGIFVREWNSITEASESIGDNTTCGIIYCCKGDCRYYKGYIWKYNFVNFIDIDIKTRRYTEIYEYDLEGNFKRRWNNSKEAALFYKGIPENIDRSLKDKNFKTALNSQWFYEYQGDKITPVMYKSAAKSIGKFDVNTGELLQIYDSLINAAHDVGGTFKAISQCALGKTKTSNGFKWKYL